MSTSTNTEHQAPNTHVSAKDVCDGLLDLIYPPKCLICGRLNPSYICEECANEVEPIRRPICLRCGHTLYAEECRNCSGLIRSFTAGRAAGQYSGGLRDAIHQFKYNGHRVLAEPLGDLMHRYLVNEADIPWGRCDCIVPVPIHPVRYRLRGYNQSELLAKRLSELTGRPLITNALVRRRYTRPQVELSPEERPTNVRGAFRVVDRRAIAGRSVLLIDDVATTCSTVHEAGLALLHAQAKAVYFLCIAFGA